MRVRVCMRVLVRVCQGDFQRDFVLHTVGEIGYSVGGCWTSMSGFTAADDAGSVQCAVLGVLLQSCQLRYWDLGMSMSYKDRMGARNVSRKKFLIMLRAVRDSTAARPLRTPPQPAFHFLRPCCSINDRVRRMPVSVRQPDAQSSAPGEGVQEVHGTVAGVTNGLFLRVRWDGCEDATEVRFEDVETTAVSDALLGDLIKSSSMQVPQSALPRVLAATFHSCHLSFLPPSLYGDAADARVCGSFPNTTPSPISHHSYMTASLTGGSGSSYREMADTGQAACRSAQASPRTFESPSE